MVERGEADAMICGLVGRYHKKLGYLRSVFGLDPGVQSTSAMTAVINDQGVWFFLDTHVQLDPSRRADRRGHAAGELPPEAVRHRSRRSRCCRTPTSAATTTPSARKMRAVRELLKARVPKLEVDGEMMADTAWDEELRLRMMPNTTLKGRANLFVLPDLDAANIAYNMVRVMTDGVAIGPILMGIDQPAHILTPRQHRRAASST